MDADEMIENALLDYVTQYTRIEVDSKEYRRLRAKLVQAVTDAISGTIAGWVKAKRERRPS